MLENQHLNPQDLDPAIFSEIINKLPTKRKCR